MAVSGGGMFDDNSGAQVSQQPVGTPGITAAYPSIMPMGAASLPTPPPPLPPQPMPTPPPASSPVEQNVSLDSLVNEEPTPAAEPMPSPAYTPTPTASTNNDDLLAIKQQALGQLSPLVSHLNQSPEEKFRTTMMLIQASDNQELIKEAYQAAQQIPDEKVRAQALLDVINEINYFTQSNDEQN